MGRACEKPWNHSRFRLFHLHSRTPGVNPMKTLPLAFVLSIAVVAPNNAFAAMTDAECATAFTTADANKDGVLSEAEGRRYYAALRVAQKPVADGKLTQADFLMHCKADAFKPATIEAGAPLKGANSFTETQAQDRAVAAGFVTVSSLKKDENGVWRGTAMDGTKSVNIAVDFKGNVVGK
jgi:hypothetical protein